MSAESTERSRGLAELDAAQRHRLISADFAAITGQVTDWDAPTPVPDWRARDVVTHLVEWSTGFFAAGGVRFAPAPDTHDDPTATWVAHAAAVGALYDEPDITFAHPMVGTRPIGDAIDAFYTSDVFMHSWDLARSAGIDPDLDPAFATRLREGMEPIDEILRSSGQYGPAMPVSDDADPVDRLMAFVGRDPRWGHARVGSGDSPSPD
ncbi:maleylpyruvate isomerase N-terminal domain-containing protein [Gordonia sp. NPDC003425]